MGVAINRDRRVAALETRKRSLKPIEIPLISAQIGETSDEAVARYVAENGPLQDVDDGEINIMVMVPFLAAGDDEK